MALTEAQSHTILGTKSQRGLVQMSLDVLFQSCQEQLVQSFYGAPAFSSLAAADVSESNMFTATAFLDTMYGDNQSERAPSRAQTPLPVRLIIFASLKLSLLTCLRLHLCTLPLLPDFFVLGKTCLRHFKPVSQTV
jgi:hypothetical protein